MDPGQIVGAPWSRPEYARRVESVVERYELLISLDHDPRDGVLMLRLLLEHPGALRESGSLDRRALFDRLDVARTELENVRAAAPLPAPIDRVDRTRVLALADFEHFIRELRIERRMGRSTGPARAKPSLPSPLASLAARSAFRASFPRAKLLRAVGNAVAVRHGVPDFFRALFPPPPERARVRVGREEEIGEGEALRVEAFGRIIAVFRDRGALLAIEDSCPHRGGPLGKGKVVDGAVVCPLHAWSFDLRSGAMRGNPSLCIRTYALAIEGGEIFLLSGDAR